MTRRSFRLLAVAAALALLIAACSSSGGAPTASGNAAGGSLASVGLAGTSWTLVDLDGTAPAGSTLTLEFREDGNAGGNAGCNTYNGTYTVDGASITFGPLVSTKMACEQPLMTMETTYLTALQATTSYRVDGRGNLVLSGTAILTFSPG